MKYLIATNHSYMLWQFRRELIFELLERGEVVLSTPFNGHERDFKEAGCRCLRTKVNRRGTNPLEDMRLLLFYRRLLLHEKPDVVITYSIKPNIYCGYMCAKLGIPYFENVQGLGTAFRRRKTLIPASVMYKLACSKACKVFFENRENAETFLKYRLISKNQIVVNPGAGVNLKHFQFREYPSEENGIRFLYLGRIMREKGFAELLEAYGRIRKKYENVSLIIAGFFDDESRELFKKKIEDLPGAEFRGFAEDPRPYYEDCHCVVLPSYHEGMSNVLLEAAATGRPIIASRVSGCREVISHETNGLLCREADADDLTDCMEIFLNRTEDERRRMGMLGREHAEQFFNKDDVVKRVLKEVDEALK